MSELLPQAGDGVVLEDEDHGEHRSSVHASQPELLTVRRPAALAPGAPLLIGAELVVSWSSGNNSVGKVRARIRPSATTATCCSGISDCSASRGMSSAGAGPGSN